MRPHLLLLESDEDVRTSLSELFQQDGFDVSEIDSAWTPGDPLCERPFHLVLVDFRVRSADPWQIPTALLARAAPAPVAVLTTVRTPPEDIAQRGFAFAILKPFPMEELLAAVSSSLCMQPPTASQEALLRAYFQALEGRDWSRLGSLCTEDMVYFVPGDNPRFSRTVRGRREFEDFASSTFGHFPDARFEVQSIHGLPSSIVVRYLGSWQDQGAVRHETMGAVRFQLAGDRIAQIGVHIDLKAIEAQGLTAQQAR